MSRIALVVWVCFFATLVLLLETSVNNPQTSVYLGSNDTLAAPFSALTAQDNPRNGAAIMPAMSEYGIALAQKHGIAIADLASWMRRGKSEANSDIRRGVLMLKVDGFPAPLRERYSQLLKDKLRIELRAIAGCDETAEQLITMQGYNNQMMKEFERRFGVNALSNLHFAAQE